MAVFDSEISKRLLQGDYPRHVLPTLAVRAAMRSLPILLESMTEGRITKQQRQALLRAFRAGFVVWAMQKYDLHTRAAVNSAARAALDLRLARPVSKASASVVLSAGSASASASASSSSRQTRSAYQSIEAALDAAYSFEGAFGKQLQESLQIDLRWLAQRKNSKDLINLPLWPEEVNGIRRTNLPRQARLRLDSFSRSPLVQKGPWGVWVEWYRALLTGGSSILDGPRAIQVSQLTTGFWNQDPDRVVMSIANMVGWPFHISASGNSVTIRDFIVGLLERERRPLSIDEIDQAFYSEGFDLTRPSIRGRLNSLTSEGRIQRVSRGMYSSVDANSLDEAAVAEVEPPVVQLEAVPPQGPGPHFRTNPDGMLDRAQPVEVDDVGNDHVRIDQLRPLVLRCASDLQTLLSRNEFPELLDATRRYSSALDPSEGNQVEWGEVWGLGIVLQNASTSAQRQIASRILPELEDPAKTALDSLLAMHGPMILATRDGARLSALANAFSMTREQQALLRSSAEYLAKDLAGNPNIITPLAAESVAQATAVIGDDPHPERGSVYGLTTIKNVAVVLVGGAAIASPAIIGALLGQPLIGLIVSAPLSLVGVEAVKKSPAFTALVTQLGAKIDAMTDLDLRFWLSEKAIQLAPFRSFVMKNELHLRHIAESTSELRWMLRYIDFITKDKV